MTWSIKLKIGIFKTQEYLFAIERDSIILTPKIHKEKEIRFADSEIKNLTFIKKNTTEYELELSTVKGMYFGLLSKESDVNELFGILSKTFGKKFLVM